MDARAPGDIFVDRFGKWIRLLEDHPDPITDFDRVHSGVVQIFAFKEHCTFDAGASEQLIHAVEGAQECAFSASGGTDNGCDLVPFDRDIYIHNGAEVTVVNAE